MGFFFVCLFSVLMWIQPVSVTRLMKEASEEPSAVTDTSWRSTSTKSYTASSIDNTLLDNTLLDTLKFFAAFDHQNNEVSVYPAYSGKNEVRSKQKVSKAAGPELQVLKPFAKQLTEAFAKTFNLKQAAFSTCL